MAITLEVLVERQDAGAEQRVDAAEFEQLYAATYRSLVSYCRRVVRSQDDAEEIAQEAFLRAWQSWDRYAPSRPFWPWVATIARRICIDRGRHSTMASATIHRRRSEICSDRVSSPEEALERTEDQRLALTALESLKPDQRRVISLRDLDGWSYEDIARFEGTTVESIRGSLRRARLHLRESYARLTWSTPAILVLGGLRRIRRRLDQWATETSQIANASSVAMARAGEAIAAVLAITMSAVSPHTAPQGVVVNSSAPSAAHAGGAAGGAGAPDGVNGSGSVTGVGGVNGVGGQYGGGGPGGAGGSANGSGPGADGSGVPGVPALLGGGVPGAPSAPSPKDATGQSPRKGPDNPDLSTFDHIQLSPNYASDHTLFLTGVSNESCSGAGCNVMYRSTDGGATWYHLDAFGFQGGSIMLPPSYPADSRVFAANPNALQVSEDGGANFTGLAPLGGPAAISPGFSTTDHKILIGAAPGWTYRDDAPPNQNLSPLDLAPLPASREFSFAFAPSYPSDNRTFVGSEPNSQDGMNLSAVSVCHDAQCDPAVELPGAMGTPTVVPSKTVGSTGLLYAFRPDRLYRSTDAGATFTAVNLPAGSIIENLVDDSAGNLYVALAKADGSGTGGVFTSHDHGSTWARLGGGTALDRGTSAVAVAPGGRLFATPSIAPGGILCSTDAGRHWSRRCA